MLLHRLRDRKHGNRASQRARRNMYCHCVRASASDESENIPIAQHKDNADEMLTGKNPARYSCSKSICSTEAVEPACLVFQKLFLDRDLYGLYFDIDISLVAV